VEILTHLFVTSAPDGGECSASYPSQFIPQENSSHYPLHG